MEKTEIIWREPWKKKEPQNRLTQKEKAALEKSSAERATMEKHSTQNVIVRFNKYLIARELVRSFTVNIQIPLRKNEIMERMAAAFPGLEIHYLDEGS